MNDNPLIETPSAKNPPDEVTFERHVGRTDVRVNGGLVATRNDNDGSVAWHGEQAEPVRNWIREQLAQIPRTVGHAAAQSPVNRAQRRRLKHARKARSRAGG